MIELLQLRCGSAELTLQEPCGGEECGQQGRAAAQQPLQWKGPVPHRTPSGVARGSTRFFQFHRSRQLWLCPFPKHVKMAQHGLVARPGSSRPAIIGSNMTLSARKHGVFFPQQIAKGRASGLWDPKALRAQGHLRCHDANVAKLEKTLSFCWPGRPGFTPSGHLEGCRSSHILSDGPSCKPRLEQRCKSSAWQLGSRNKA